LNRFGFWFLLVVFPGFAACGQDGPVSDGNVAIERAMASVRAAEAIADSDVARPLFHFRPPAYWMNDPNGTIFRDGYLELFYQHNPYGDQWGNMHWGHARSRDLVHWEHLPIALWPSKDQGEEHCFSGSAAFSGDGRPLLFYTSVAPSGGRAFEQWAALGSPDWLKWQKVSEIPVDGQTLELRAFLDRSVLEVFVADGSVVASRVTMPTSGASRIQAFADGGSAVMDIEFWQMDGIWPHPDGSKGGSN
jgi:sucrose-6-phosphate hydrolase SacC (GH32 family)